MRLFYLNTNVLIIRKIHKKLKDAEKAERIQAEKEAKRIAKLREEEGNDLLNNLNFMV